MLSLNLLAKQKFSLILETKSLLKLFGSSFYGNIKFHEVAGQNVYKTYYKHYSTEKVKNEVVKSPKEAPKGEMSTLETVRQTTTTVTYSGLIALGLGITGIIFYTIFSELFSGNSASNIYSKALDRCLKNEKVVLSLGEPIKAFGEENLRGRRRHTNHLVYKKDEVNHLRMKFYIKGSRKKATVHLEMKENESRNFEYRYLFVQLDEYPYTTIVLEDNRGEKPSFIQPTAETLKLT